MVFKGSGPKALAGGPKEKPYRNKLIHMVTFTPVYSYQNGVRPVRVLLGDGAAKATADSGWAVVSRPKQKGFTTWEGYAPYTMVVKVMFDGLHNNETQEHEYDALRKIMRVPVGPKSEPSPLKISGAVPLTNLLWVVQNLEPDESNIIRRESDGHMVRCPVTVTLLEYVEADVAISVRPSPAKAAAQRAVAAGKPPVQRTYTVKKGDTLSKIAARLLGSYKRYPEIAKLNGIRDPNRIFPGDVLKIP